jgi:bifunctional non-homologous end joining protein LigD
VPDFNLLRAGAAAALYAFDLLEHDGAELRREPIEARKEALGRLIGADGPRLLLSQSIDTAADVAFTHICKLGLEGIVSKRRGSLYESGRSERWVKTINPNAPAVIRLLEEDWNK